MFLGERYGGAGGGADHRFTLYGIVNFGGRSPVAWDAADETCTVAGADWSGAPAPAVAPVVSPGAQD